MQTKNLLMLLCAASIFCFYSCNSPEAAKNNMAEKNKLAVQKIYDAYMSGNTDSLGNYVADNMKENAPDPAATFDQQGLAGIKHVVAMYHTAFPDVKISVMNMLADGDIVASHYHWTGTNTGPMGTMPATNKP